MKSRDKLMESLDQNELMEKASWNSCVSASPHLWDLNLQVDEEERREVTRLGGEAVLCGETSPTEALSDSRTVLTCSHVLSTRPFLWLQHEEQDFARS